MLEDAIREDVDMPQDAAPSSGAAPRPRRRLLKRILIGVGGTLGLLIALAGALYLFGGMAAPSPEMAAAYDQLVAEGRVAPVERRFVIRIPGCTCHSSDPILTMEHSQRRIRECSGCHAR